MQKLYDSCTGAPALAELAQGRNPVYGCGPLDSPFMVVCAAPDTEDEKRGRPFCGPAGQLLRELFVRAEIPWRLCYLACTVPWRPPGGRPPYPYQVQASAPRLWQEIMIVDPIVVVAAGAFAWRAVARNQLGPFDQVRLEWQELNGRRLLAVPDPADLLDLGEGRLQQERATVAALAEAIA